MNLAVTNGVKDTVFTLSMRQWIPNFISKYLAHSEVQLGTSKSILVSWACSALQGHFMMTLFTKMIPSTWFFYRKQVLLIVADLVHIFCCIWEIVIYKRVMQWPSAMLYLVPVCHTNKKHFKLLEMG